MKRKNILIMFAAVVLFAMVGSNRILAQKSNYVHHNEWDNENLVSKTIYEHDKDHITFVPYKKEEFIYDKNDRIQSRNVYYWSRMNSDWVMSAVYTYNYTDGIFMVEMSKCKPGYKKKQTKGMRCLYEIDDSWNLLSYKSYKWQEKGDLWVLIDEVVAQESVSFLGTNKEDSEKDKINKVIMAMK